MNRSISIFVFIVPVGLFRVGDEHDPGLFRDPFRHGIEVVPPVLARHDHVRTAGGLRDHLVHHKGRVGRDHFIAGLNKGADRQFDELVRTVAQDDPGKVDIIVLASAWER